MHRFMGSGGIVEKIGKGRKKGSEAGHWATQLNQEGLEEGASNSQLLEEQKEHGFANQSPEAIAVLQKSMPAAVFSCGCTASAADAVWLPSWFCDPPEAPEKHGCISAVGSEETRAGEGVGGHQAPAQS